MTNPWDNDPIVKPATSSAAPAAAAPWEADPIVTQAAPVAPGSNQASNVMAPAGPAPTVAVAPASNVPAGLDPELTGETPIAPTFAGPTPTGAPTVQGSVDPRVNASIDAGVRGIANGATLGLADRGAALAESATGLGGTRGDYAANLAREQAATHAAEAEHPVASIAGNLVGGAVVPLGVVGTMAQEAGLGAKVAHGVGVGAGLGGVQGALSSHDLTNGKEVAANAAIGGALGGVVGGSIPLAAKGIGAVYSALASRIGNKAAGDLDPKAAAELLKAIEADGPDNVLRNLQMLGEHGMLADAGENLGGVTQGQVLKAGRGTIEKALTERNLGTDKRLLAAVDDAVGTAEPAADIQAGINAARTGAVEPHFAAASQAPAPIGAGMDEIATRDTVKAGLRDAAKVASDNGTPLRSVLLDEHGNVVPSDAAETLQAGQRERLSNGLGQMLGYGSALKEADQILAARSAEAGPLYEAARATNIDYSTPEGQELLKVLPRVMDNAGSHAREIMKLDGSAPGGRWVGGADGAVEGAAPGLGAPAKAPAPVSLGRYIAKNGGINLDGGDAAHAGLDQWSIPFAGKVAREDGRSIDSHWREALIERGYLPPDTDGGMSRDVRGEVMHLLSEERAGRPSYPINAEARARGIDPAQAAHEAELLDRAKGEVLASALKKGVAPKDINPEALDTAALAHASSDGTSDAFGHYQEALTAGPVGAAPADAAGRVFHPDVSTLHYYKRGLDNLIGSANRSGNSDVARAAMGLKREFVEALDKAVPEYGQARQVFSDQSAMNDALTAGREAIRKGQTGEEISRAMVGMTDAEAEMYRLGAAHEMKASLAKKSDTADLSKVLFGNKATRDQIQALAPSREAFGRFKGVIADEKQAFTEAVRPSMEAWTNTYRSALEKAKKLDPSSREGEAAMKAVTDLREQLEQVPGFARGAERSDFYDRLQGAFDKGGKILRAGDEAIHPAVLKRELDTLSPSEWAVMRKGTRAEIDRLLGTKANDLVALKSALQGEGGWNAEKLSHLFGGEQADKLIASVKREAKMRGTYDKVVGNSQTAQRTAAAKGQADGKAPKIPIGGESLYGDAKRLVRHGVEKVASIALKPDNGERDKQIATALTRKGPEAMQVLGDLLNLSARRAARPVAAERLGGRAALGAGLTVETYAEHRRRLSGAR